MFTKRKTSLISIRKEIYEIYILLYYKYITRSILLSSAFTHSLSIWSLSLKIFNQSLCLVTILAHGTLYV